MGMQTKDALEQWFSPVQVTTTTDQHIHKRLRSPEDFQKIFLLLLFQLLLSQNMSLS